MRWTLVPTPIDDLLIAADEWGICAVSFGGGRPERGGTGGRVPGERSRSRGLAEMSTPPALQSERSGSRGLADVGPPPAPPGEQVWPAGDQVAADADPLLRAAADQLTEYFAGGRTDFTLPLSVRRGSAFERAVWTQMTRIPHGETRTYGQIAAAVQAELSRPGDDGADPGPQVDGFGAARAVGVACNRNPLPVVVPCHRVVGAGNKLVGFGGGLPRKRFLLELEARVNLERMLS